MTQDTNESERQADLLGKVQAGGKLICPGRHEHEGSDDRVG